MQFNSKESDSPDTSTDGEVLLEDISAFLRRFITFQDETHVHFLALWSLHTWAIESAHATPYVHITSAEPGCGKTRLIEVLELLVREPVQAVSISPAALYRMLDQGVKTMLIDEADAMFRRGSETGEIMRPILNAGYRRGGQAIRCVGKEAQNPTPFETFGAKVIAGLDNGGLDPSLASRTVKIVLRRRLREEGTGERFRRRKLKEHSEEITARCARWADQHQDALEASEPDPHGLETLDDRQFEIFEPLLAIAAQAGGAWTERARVAAIHLCSTREATESFGVTLLRDARTIFHHDDVDKVKTSTLINRLRGLESAPWENWGRNRSNPGLTPRDLSQLLKPYGITPGSIRFDDDTNVKGYRLEDFEDAWSRYLPGGASEGGSSRHSVTTESQSEPQHFPSRHNGERVTDPTRPASASQSDCDGVTDENAATPPTALDVMRARVASRQKQAA